MVAASESHYLSVAQMATYLGIGKSLAYQLIADKKVPHIRLGRRIVISRSALERMTEQDATDAE